jgi:hypothetical protein
MTISDTKEGTLLDRELAGHGSVPVKDIFSPEPRTYFKPVPPADDGSDGRGPGDPRPPSAKV